MATTTTTQSDLTNGVNGHHAPAEQTYPRFSDIPAVIDIPVRGEDGDEAVNLDLTELLDETDELCDLLENENAARTYWVTIALAYAKQNKVNIAIDILNKGLAALAKARSEDRLSVLTCLCWLYLWKCRHAPRVKPTQPLEDERNKEHFLHMGTQTLNEASRINPSYPPLFLARGTLYLLRASLQPSKSTHSDHSERNETLKQAVKSFDDAYRASNGKNVMAIMGKAKAQFSLGSVAQALSLYQQALERAPDMLDPDPRIGIGCCLWQLGHKEPARAAFQRSLDLNPDSISANILLGLYYLEQANQYNPKDEAFMTLYKQAMTTHTQTAFKLDGMHALTCATFCSYFLLRKVWNNVERLARRAIEHTDVNAIASDGWYLLGRKEHHEGDLQKANEHYTKADQARGGDDKGYVPAKFGNAQIRVSQRDFEGAKFKLEKIVEKSQPKSVEAMTLLGVLYAEEVFANQATGGKEDKSQEAKKAIGMFEHVRTAWKDAKRKNLQPDQAVLLNLARLYEHEAPEKALACLLQVEEMEIEDINEDDLPDEIGEDEPERRLKRELLSPQLLNNIGCFHFAAEKFTEAREDFQTALSACVKLGERQAREEGVEDFDTDALVSTISYNLARTYEAEKIDDEAIKIYQGLLERHPDYVDANTRLAYLAFKANPSEGGEAIKRLMESDPSNLEVRSLYGWYLNRTKKRTLALNEDAEQRHYKHTLQTYDKHDLYSLTGMGNLHLHVAREMPRDTDAHKERRSKTWMRAVEFFDKVLTLDPRNAYAAQGMGIAVMEDKRDTAAAIQIFSKVRESVRDGSSVHVNLGHIFTEVKQFSRAIENYELALAKLKLAERERGRDSQILAWLGRVWLMRGRQEKRLDAYKTALDFSRQALESAPDNINYRFNVAFVQIQLAQMVISLPEASKSLAEVEQAAQGLDEAIDAFGEIAKMPNPPFPRGDIEQRANMGRNTMKRQLASALERQAEYEKKNAHKLEEARRKREEEVARREEEKKAAEERLAEERRRLREERERLAEEDRLLIERRMDEEKAREAAEWTTDEETGERKKREKKPKEKRQKRKKKGEDTDTDADGVLDGEGMNGTGPSDGEAPARRNKKRKLESRKGRATSSKYKSADIVEDSSDDEDMKVSQPAAERDEDEESAVETPRGGGDLSDALPDEDEVAPAVSRLQQRKKIARVLDDDDDEEDEEMEDDAARSAGTPQAGDSDHGGDAL